MVFLNATLGHIPSICVCTCILKLLQCYLLAQMTFYSNPLMSVTLLSALRALTIIK